MSKGNVIHAKAKCCKDGPRCKRCPVVCKRLEKAGYLERQNRRTWVVLTIPTKRAVKLARG